MRAAAKLTLALCVLLSRLPARCHCEEVESTASIHQNDAANATATSYDYYEYIEDVEGQPQDYQTNADYNKTIPDIHNPQHEHAKPDNEKDSQVSKSKPENKAAEYNAGAEPETDIPVSPCDDNSLIIRVTSGYMQYYSSEYGNKRNQVLIPYGIIPKVSCDKRGAESARLTMTIDGVQQVLSENMIEGAVESTMSSDQQKSEFNCTDIQTGCESSVSILIKQVIHVVSPNLVSSYPPYAKLRYGTPMSVLCSGPADSRLAITKNGTTLKAEPVNNNTIKIFVREPDYPTSEYDCINLDTNMSDRVYIEVLPAIFIRSRNKTITPDYLNMYRYMHMYRVTYGDPIDVYCSAPRDVKFMLDHVQVLPEKVNNTAVKFSINNLKVGESLFGCIDSKSNVVNTNDVHVIVTLRMDVVSPNVRRFGSRYVVKPGEPMEILCSGPAVGPLTLSKNGNTAKDIHIVNDTSIKWVINKSEIHDGYEEYVCSSKEAKLPQIVFMCGVDPTENDEIIRNEEEKHARVTVEVSIPPTAMDFNCVSHALKFLNCSWSALSYGINFSLSYTDNGNTIPVCEIIQTVTGPTFCVFVYRVDIKTFSFLMQSCNGLGCTNQSFFIEHLSIVKPNPPSPVTVESRYPRGVQLRWDLTSLECAGERLWSHRNFEHKVEYSTYTGMVISANANIQCYVFPYCTAFLSLPCPGQLYEVRVYHKLQTAVGDDYWSEPSSVTFSTDIDNKSDVVDRACNQPPKKTKEVMTYFVQELRQDIRLDMQQMKKEVSLLHKKLNVIRTYLEDRTIQP